MPLYEYVCKCGHRFDKQNSMENRHNVSCPECGSPARLKYSCPAIRMANPITFYQELPGGKGYQEIGWKPDSGLSHKIGQPDLTR
jgi:putative FmdB family regulatory protein